MVDLSVISVTDLDNFYGKSCQINFYFKNKGGESKLRQEIVKKLQIIQTGKYILPFAIGKFTDYVSCTVFDAGKEQAIRVCVVLRDGTKNGREEALFILKERTSLMSSQQFCNWLIKHSARVFVEYWENLKKPYLKLRFAK